MGIINRLIRRLQIKLKLFDIRIFHKNINVGRGMNCKSRFAINCSKEGKIVIGNRVFFNSGCFINAKQSITIGDNCIFGEAVKIYDYNYRLNKENDSITNQGYSDEPVTIGCNCWIDSNAVILAGTSIGDNSAVAAGCVVKGEIPANVVVKQTNDITKEPIFFSEGVRMNNNAPPIVSIIMPVYNSEKYVGQAIQSVLKQSFEDFELIIVNDGSTDGSGYKCEQYAGNDARIVVVHKENGGVCSARNLGIEMSRGTFITFIDNDDYYEDNFLKVLVNTATATDSDLTKAGRRNIKITSDMKVISTTVCTYKKSVVLSQAEFSSQYYDFKNSGILSSIWNGLYKRELIDASGIRFDENVKYGNEDLIFNCNYSLLCNTISIVPDVLYTHFYRLGHSTSTKFNPDQILTRIDGINLELEIVGENADQTELIMLEGIRACFRMLLPLRSAEERKPYIGEIEERLEMSVMKRCKIFTNSRLSKESKIDLLLLKNRMYGLYFFLRRMRTRME